MGFSVGFSLTNVPSQPGFFPVYAQQMTQQRLFVVPFHALSWFSVNASALRHDMYKAHIVLIVILCNKHNGNKNVKAKPKKLKFKKS